ncbi:MAG: methylmalonyl-CoA mutase family protein [Chloroflexota bacterium]
MVKKSEVTAEIVTRAGIPVKPVYTPADLKGWKYEVKLNAPGEYPFTRGAMTTRYRETFTGGSQYIGFGTPESTNKWFKYLIGRGATGGALAWDLPTQIGYDADHPMAAGEVGKAGVSICSLADMETVYDGIPIETMGVMTLANAVAPIYLAWSIVLLKKRGVPAKEMRIGMQNDILKEFVCRGTQIFPLRPSLKFSCDTIEYAVRNGMKNVRPVSICGSHFRQAGGTAVQEIAFSIADHVAYFEELLSRGLKIDDLAPYSNTMFIGAGMDFFEEIAKLRAIRRTWARVMKEKFGCKTPPLITSRGNGRDFTAQQPLNNLIRGTIELLAAVLGGCPNSQVSSYDEALAIPSPEAATLAMRTQQIIAYESGVNNTTDPLAGSYFVEALTDELEEKSQELLTQVEDMGGALPAIEQGFFQRELTREAYEKLRLIETGERILVGVNKYVVEEELKVEVRKVDPAEERRQVAKVKKLRKERDNAAVKAGLKQLKEAAQDGVNLVPVLVDVVKTYATIGEMCDTLRSVWGEYKAMGL